ncbi:polycystin-2-like isoform X1 [Amphibalanus amphitrite]|uniref:polycystin-2-like isoform X1 n=1 Tax=Amphibalanus amphitrite TaxID=1232801 RepID=UPI001C919589|nr:polycystin-2-like isoform X1 [Amphibalanus amphitrite]
MAGRPSSGKEALWSKDDPNSMEAYGDDPDVRQDEPKGCWGSFTNCIGGMWTTRQMTHTTDREIVVRTTLRELVVYLVFLIILCILTFGMTSPTMYYYTKVLSELFLDTPYPDTRNTFRGSTQVMDFWRFVEGPMMDGLYWDAWYDHARTSVNKHEQNILYENRMLGVPRMRQLRVRDDSCNVHETFAGAINKCYSVYSESIEDKTSFGPRNGTAWNYYSQSELKSQSVWGMISTYSGAGSYVDLSHSRNATIEILSSLRRNLWIGRGTRAVFIDFTVYNANINLFCVIRLIFEFPATGGMIPSSSFRTVKLLRYVTPFDYFVMACEWIFAFFVLYYIVEEVLEVRKMKCAYFKSVWNILDILVIGIATLCIAFSVYRTNSVDDKLESLLKDGVQYANFEQLGFYQTQFNSAVAMCVFFAWIKLFKYISFNKTMTQLSSTLSRCAKDVMGFAIMFFIVFFAFAQLGYLLFGTQVRDFSSFGNATFTLLRTILGDFNFHEIEAANRVLGPIFFLAYVFFVFFVLMNMFLAIINDTYSEVKNEISAQKNEFEIADYFKRGYNNMMGKLGRRDKVIDIQNALKLAEADKDGEISFDEIRKNLKKCNFSDIEIEMFFSRYDRDGSRTLGGDEHQRMMADLEDEKNHLDSQLGRPSSGRRSRPGSAFVGGGVPHEEFMSLKNRVDRMEHSIGSIVSKIDAVLIKLEGMEKGKPSQRKDSVASRALSKMDDVAPSPVREPKKDAVDKLVQEELDNFD